MICDFNENALAGRLSSEGDRSSVLVKLAPDLQKIPNCRREQMPIRGNGEVPIHREHGKGAVMKLCFGRRRNLYLSNEVPQLCMTIQASNRTSETELSIRALRATKVRSVISLVAPPVPTVPALKAAKLSLSV